MRREFDIVIVGSGVAGATLAALLPALRVCAAERVALLPSTSRREVTPGDALPSDTARPSWNLRVFALSRASQRVLQWSGIWDRISPALAFPYERMCVWDAAGEANGRGSIEFDAAALGEANLGHIVDGRELQVHSIEAARTSGVSLIDALVTTIDAAGVGLSDGTTLETQLVIAADGADSPTRDLLGIDTAGHVYHQEALVAHVRTTRPHANTAWQRFLPSGPLAFLPLSDGRSSIVWSNSSRETARLAALDPAAFAAALTDASGAVLGTCEVASAVARFPLHLQYARDYVQPGAALLGDAAHSVHPLAGQGLNIGLLDCATLAQVLGARDHGERFGDLKLLRRYERRRRSGNYAAASGLDGLERLFTNDNPLLKFLRGAGLELAGRLPFIKNEIARRALGLAGDVPDFIRGDRFLPRQ